MEKVTIPYPDGLPRTVFIDLLGKYRIPVWNYDAEELEREIREVKDRV